MKLLIYGKPGTGKGTASEFLCELYSIPHISMGDILRAEIQKETELGKKAKQYIDQGNLVPDNLLFEVAKTAVRHKDGFILDGYPRTVGQAANLVIGIAVDAMLDLEADDDTVIQRMLGRGRADDTEEIIRKRLEVYDLQTKPVLEFLRKHKSRRWPIISIDSNGTIEQTADAILVKLNELEEKGRFGLAQN